MLGKLYIQMQKNEIVPLFYTIQKISSEWIRDLNILTETLKLLEENIRKTILTLVLAMIFLKYYTKSTSNKSKNQQVGLCQTKMSLHSKRNNQQNEKLNYGIFANCISDDGINLQNM